jgi:alanyl-tRNA synthetase
MKTVPLYYKDPDQFHFSARVVKLRPCPQGFQVLLDRTLFYPEGGGQPPDHGTIGGIGVIDVRKEEGEIWHSLAAGEVPPSLSPGDEVDGTVDESRRNDYRQQHTGQHIISAAFTKIGDFPTVSVHQGEAVTTIELAVPEISDGDILAVEALANRVVNENRPLHFHWTDREGLESFDLRRPTSQEGSIRIVEIEDFDQAACGGVHFHSTGPVGLIKYLGHEKIRGQVRTIWAIGDRALSDYQRRVEVCGALTELTSSPLEELPRRVEEILQENSRRQAALKETNRRIADFLTREILDRKQNNILTASLRENKEVFREISQILTRVEDLRFCLTNIPPEEPERIFWYMGHGDGGTLPFGELKGDLLPLIQGKGGGKPPLYQGAGDLIKGEAEFLEAFRVFL